MKLIRDMDFTEIVDWATGRLIVSIGRGEFRSEVATVLQAVIFETKQPRSEDGHGKKSRKSKRKTR
jgi:hypothetical protein